VTTTAPHVVKAVDHVSVSRVKLHAVHIDGQTKAEATEFAWAAWMAAMRHTNRQDFLDAEAQRAAFEAWWSAVDRICSVCGCVMWGSFADELHNALQHRAHEDAKAAR
jgi:hypothetical protein